MGRYGGPCLSVSREGYAPSWILRSSLARRSRQVMDGWRGVQDEMRVGLQGLVRNSTAATSRFALESDCPPSPGMAGETLSALVLRRLAEEVVARAMESDINDLEV